MAYDLPDPLPDEPLFGVVARYGHLLRVRNWPVFLFDLFGYHARFSPSLLYNIAHVAGQTQSAWGMGTNQIVRERTLYPLLATFTSVREGDVMYDRLVTRRSRKLPSFMIELLQQPKIVRLCQACVIADRDRFGMAYWHRAHQMPGVVTCPTHGTWLHAIEYTPGLATAWPRIDSAAEASPSLELVVSNAQRENIQRVARASEYFLNGHEWVDAAALRTLCRSVVHNHGFAYGREGLAQERLRQSFIAHFGESYLRSVALYPSNRQNWLESRLNDYQVSSCVLPNILLGLFCGRLAEQGGDEAWPFCPNPLAGHGRAHAVEVREKISNRFYARCRCGYSFTYAGVDSGIPCEVVATVYGPDYARKAQELHLANHSVAQTARALGVSESTARRMVLIYDADVTPNRHESVALLIDRWREAVCSAGNTVAASRSRPGLWKAMRRYAPESISIVN